MKVIIIEDEERTARQLVRMLLNYDPTIEVLALLPSVKEAVNWFKQNPMPDIAFMDIHLEDGQAFSIFEQVNLTVPVIFTTAYDEYMLKAFKVNSIDYLLKPIDYDDLVRALEKFKSLQVNPSFDMNALLQLVQKPKEPTFKDRFMVTVGTKIYSIETEDIAFFYSEEKATFLMTKAGQLLTLEHSLDNLENQLNPVNFFRMNRQFLVARKAIKSIQIYSPTKIKLDLAPVSRKEVFVSVHKVPDFKDWLGR
ncbi:LytTR family DNA-binding domain-containing protein [Emticicia sp. C21]|uniref:LytR/AlgR family response regulator transcription factor n=1 Tax=Emticicia sp. C21 TaxID=2302915 RepID=UPI000E351796|nr:LytTR family DNA-binding domain-containing protein [Emticicia sp. C21]RFS17746.1 DNA-binding response regulator [Emticicia sp. C21]